MFASDKIRGGASGGTVSSLIGVVESPRHASILFQSSILTCLWMLSPYVAALCSVLADACKSCTLLQAQLHASSQSALHRLPAISCHAVLQ